MNKSIHIIAGAIAIFAMSCENTTPVDMTPVEKTVIIANAATEAVESRTAIDNTQYEGGHVGILWTSDDAIGVYGGTVKNARFGCSASTPAGRAEFTGSCASPQYAYYPYSPGNDGKDVTSLTGSLPAEQTYNSATGTLDGDYKYGRPRTDADNEFDFTHIFSLFRFEIEATGTPLAGETLQSVSLELPQNRQLAGDFTFNATDGTYAFTGNTSNTVTMKWSNTPSLTSGRTYTAYMSAAPDLHADDAVVITVLTDKHKATFTKAIAYDFTANSVYTFRLRLSDFADEMNVEEVVPEPEEETANCYMITSAGMHDFKATVIGNGQKGIIPGAGFHTDDATINPVSAKLLWEDVNGFISNVELRDGRVYYKTTANTGNAVIAVYDGPDATGKILWSWHIWGVGDTLPGTYDYTTKGGVVNRIMDRDLGAFPATDEQRLQTTRVAEDEETVCHAMLYQWGRKDPMPNSIKRYVDGVETDLTAFPVWKGTSQAEHTIAASIQHPMELINAFDSSTGNWLENDIELLWGDGKFSGKNASGRWTDVKTIYDPSPVGYRVPNYYTFDNFIPTNTNISQLKGVSGFSTVNGVRVPSLCSQFNCVIDTVYQGTVARYLPKGIHKERIGYAGGVTANANKMFGYGVYVKRFENDTEGSYYPATGYLILNSSSSRTNYGKSSWRWLSCGAVTNTAQKGCLWLGWFAYRTSSYNTGVDQGLPSGSSGVVGEVKTQDFTYPWCAYAVRCVKE